MKLEGSCHCRAVRFSVLSRTPQPYMRCYCSICRKTAGGGGYAINVMGEASTLRVHGKSHVATYRVRARDTGHGADAGPDDLSEGQRHFCRRCGSALYVGDARWPQWVWPFASAIDTPLPTPPETIHIMTDFAPAWALDGLGEPRFAGYPPQSIADWHKAHGVYDAEGSSSPPAAAP